MITANFNTYANYVTDSLYQWDLNQILSVSGLNLSVAPEVHFSNSTMDRAIVRHATMVNGVVNVAIPNSILQDPLTIHAHIGIYEGNTFKVVERVDIPVIAKKRPSDYQIQDSDEEIYSFKALENLLNNKADNARVDYIIAHNNDTNGNSELVDIRTDIDGKVHASAGDAVRKQIGEMYEYVQGKIDVDSWIDDVYVDVRNGLLVPISNAPYHASDFIPVLPGTIRVKVAMGEDASGIVFYDESKVFISGVNVSGGTVHILNDTEISVPVETKYVRVTHYGDVSLFELRQIDIYGSILQLNKSDRYYETLTWTEKSFIDKNNGDVKSINVAYYATGFVEIIPGTSVTLKTMLNNDASGIAFYDKDKKFISGDNPASKQADIVRKTYIVPDNAYYLRFTCYNDVSLASICVSDDINGLKKTNAKINSMITADYRYAVNKVLCIGDSLTSGAYYGNNYDVQGGSIAENYPFMLGRMINGEVTNGGYSGYSASDWYTKNKNTYNFADYDTVIIWLGTNNGYTKTWETDVKPYGNNYESYANTETGYLCKIIQAIKQSNPDCLICIGTVFASKGNVSDSNAIITQLASEYGLLLLDFSDLSVSNFPKLHNGIDNPHFGKAGNIYIADRIVKRLSEYFNADPLRCEFGLTART